MEVIVIGGGAAGMIAAITSAKEGNNVTLIEKKSTLGNKVKITGKGRCNITFDGDIDNFKSNIVKNYKFMYSSFNNFNNNDVIDYFENLGVKTKVERGGRIFPVSDKAEDVVYALEKELKNNNVKIIYNTSVKKIVTKEQVINSVILDNGKEIICDKCIVATGGMSYKTTGSTGDGYTFAKDTGHKIVEILPGLVPLKSDDKICKDLQGLSLKNVTLTLKEKSGKKIYEEFGEMMFSHFGITGPIVLSSSSKLNRYDNVNEKINNHEIIASVDLKPALDIDTLDKRICRDFEKYTNKEFKNSLNDLLPQKLIPVIMSLSKIDENKKVHQINKKERAKLVEVIKNLQVNITGFMPIDIAIVTSGGVDVKDINPKTMESKIVKGLYFAGEVLDIDAYTGGFNLQIAFSTGYAAGRNM